MNQPTTILLTIRRYVYVLHVVPIGTHAISQHKYIIFDMYNHSIMKHDATVRQGGEKLIRIRYYL